MSNGENWLEDTLTIGSVVKIGFALGAGVGILMIPIMYFLYRSDLSATDILLIPLVAPLLNALTVSLYGLVGYPLYLYLARKRKFGLHKLSVQQKNKKAQ